MPNLILAGDSLLTVDNGYGAFLEASILIAHPSTLTFFHTIKNECDTFSQITERSSGVIIGRAPHGILLSLGLVDISQQASLDSIMNDTKEALAILKDKTRAPISLTNIALDLINGSELAKKAQKYNLELTKVLPSLSVNLVDIDSVVNDFLNKHTEIFKQIITEYKINKKVRKLALAQTLSKKNSDKNLKISWLGVESNHWLTVFTRCSTINPEELLSYLNQLFYNDN